MVYDYRLTYKAALLYLTGLQIFSALTQGIMHNANTGNDIFVFIILVILTALTALIGAWVGLLERKVEIKDDKCRESSNTLRTFSLYLVSQACCGGALWHISQNGIGGADLSSSFSMLTLFVILLLLLLWLTLSPFTFFRRGLGGTKKCIKG